MGQTIHVLSTQETALGIFESLQCYYPAVPLNTKISFSKTKGEMKC